MNYPGEPNVITWALLSERKGQEVRERERFEEAATLLALNVEKVP